MCQLQKQIELSIEEINMKPAPETQLSGEVSYFYVRLPLGLPAAWQVKLTES